MARSCWVADRRVRSSGAAASQAARTSSSSALLCRRKEDGVCCASTHNGECSASSLHKHSCVLLLFFFSELPLKINVEAFYNSNLWPTVHFPHFFLLCRWLVLCCDPFCSRHRSSLGFGGKCLLAASCQQFYHTWPAILAYKNNFVKEHLTMFSCVWCEHWSSFSLFLIS